MTVFVASRFARGITAVLSLVAFSALTAKETRAAWPERRITIIIPVAAGGGADPVVRFLADGLSKQLGQPVIVDFRPGANSTIGARAVVNAPPDGYTLLFTSPSPIVQARFNTPDMTYDSLTDLQPISQLAEAPLSLVANANFPPKNFKEFVEYAKANPGKVKVAVPGVGGSGQQAAAIVAAKTGIKFTMVPYSGTGALAADLLAGHVDAATGFTASFLSGIADGRLRGLAVLSDKRTPELPDVPSTAESGYPEARLTAWYNLYGQKNLPKELADRIGDEVRKFLRTKEAKDKFESFGYNITATDAETARKVAIRDIADLKELYDSGALQKP